MMKLFLILLLSAQCLADVSLSVGVGKGAINRNGTPFERAIVAGYQFPVSDFFVRPEAGYFMVPGGGQGVSSLWAAIPFGVTAVSKVGNELHIGFGPGYLQNPDSVLGGHFQFSLEGGTGINTGRVYIGMAIKHMSSAGFEMPNLGRDFIVVQLRLLRI